MGFYEGVTDIVTKPMKGAKEEGALGFFKGVGKGSMNLIAKPGSGKSQMRCTQVPYYCD